MTTNYSLFEVNANKAVQGAAFGQGTQDYVFSIGQPNCWNPSRSYFKIDMTLLGPDGTTQPVEGDLLAFADNCAGNLFTNAYMRMGGQDISTITSFLPQASALKKRLGKSGAWLEKIGKSEAMNSASFATRCLAVSSRCSQSNLSTDYQDFYKGAITSIATVSIDAAGIVTGNTTQFQTGINAVQVGDTLVVAFGAGVLKYTVASVTDNETLQLDMTAGVTVVPNTGKFHFIRRNVQNTDIGKNTISIIYQPPLGVFDHNGWLGAGDYRISLTPSAGYAIQALESKLGAAAIQAAEVTVNDIRFYCYQGKASIPQGVHNLGLTECMLASKTMVNGNSNNSFQFSVPPSTMYLTVFVQANTAGSDPTLPLSMFKARSLIAGKSGDTTIQSIQVTYASITKPSTRWTSEFKGQGDTAVAGNVQQLTQRYHDTYMEANNAIDGVGAVESIGEWIQRGPYYHFIFSRDLSDRSTEVNVNITMSDIVEAQCFLAAWYHNTVQYNVAEGMITQVVSRQI